MLQYASKSTRIFRVLLRESKYIGSNMQFNKISKSLKWQHKTLGQSQVVDWAYLLGTHVFTKYGYFLYTIINELPTLGKMFFHEKFKGPYALLCAVQASFFPS